VFDDFHRDIDKIPSTGNKEIDTYIKNEWRKLLIGEPPAQRLLSPMDGAQTGHFDPDFFTKTGWIDQFKKVFSKQPLLIDMNEGYPEGTQERGIWEMRANPVTNELIFTNRSGGKYSPMRLQLPAKPLSNNPARDILGGNGPGWGLNPDLNSPIRKLQDALIRNFSVAIETNTLTTTQAPGGVGQAYFSEMRGKQPSAFYASNSEMASMGGPQFFNVYAEAVHANADNGQVYTHAYDDEGTQSGAAAFTIEEFETGTITLGNLKS
jgi:Beta-1,3-glucanase